jgi:hypothetical protein
MTNQLIGMKSVYTTTTDKLQKVYIDYYPVTVFTVIDVLKKNKVTPNNADIYRELFEDIPVCNNIAHMRNKALSMPPGHLINKFLKSNTRIKEFVFLENLNHFHKIGFSGEQYNVLRSLCGFDLGAEVQQYDTQVYSEVKIRKDDDIIVVKSGEFKALVEKFYQCVTNEIKKFDMNILLISVPVCVNFEINYVKKENCIESCSLYKISPSMREPECVDLMITFRMCIEMHGITEDCDIGMSEEHFEQFQNLCNF